MSQIVCVLVRIAVLVPQKLVAPLSDAGEPCCPGCDQVCPRRAGHDSFLPPGVTVEMAAFFREHPDNN